MLCSLVKFYVQMKVKAMLEILISLIEWLGELYCMSM